MIDGIEPLYQQIADSIREAIEEEWSTAKMDAIFYPGSSTYFGEYTRRTDGKLRDFGTTIAGQRTFREIRKKFKEAGKKPWGGASFELHADGTFDMKWNYDGCDENGDTIFVEAEEYERFEGRRKRLTSI
jgi:hypothetical protein